MTPMPVSHYRNDLVVTHLRLQRGCSTQGPRGCSCGDPCTHLVTAEPRALVQFRIGDAVQGFIVKFGDVSHERSIPIGVRRLAGTATLHQITRRLYDTRFAALPLFRSGRCPLDQPARDLEVCPMRGVGGSCDRPPGSQDRNAQ